MESHAQLDKITCIAFFWCPNGNHFFFQLNKTKPTFVDFDFSSTLKIGSWKNLEF